MRYVLILFALLLIAAPALAAEPQSPRGIVFAHECKQVNPKVTGFSCEFNGGDLTIRFHEQQSQMSPERRELVKYEFTKIALRYFELGGTGFDVQADFWAPNQRRLCSHVKNRPFYVYGCSDYTVKN